MLRLIQPSLRLRKFSTVAGVGAQLPNWAREEILARGEEASRKLVELEKQLSQVKPGTDEFVQVSKECSFVQQVSEKWKVKEQLTLGLKEAQDLLSEPDVDAEMKQLATEEQAMLLEELQNLDDALVDMLIPVDQLGKKNAIIEVRPGVGGDEAGLFASELFEMYERFVAAKNWKWEPLIHKMKETGLREGVAVISTQDYGGETQSPIGVYGLMKCESGVHRVQRVPATENQGRVHTSTASVLILPEADTTSASISESDLRIDTYRSSGAGGQHVNTTESAVRITHVPTGITVAIQDERSQHANRKKAMRILSSRVLEHFEAERIQKEQSLKSSLVQTGDRSEKIRTYNYSRDQIVDHRLGKSIFGIESTLRGSLDLESEFMLPLYCQQVLHALEMDRASKQQSDTDNAKQK